MMASPNRVYNDFEPITEWASEEGSDTLLVFLPGFKSEEIKVQITTARNLRIMGECQVGDNQWSRFRKEFPIASNHDSPRISARFRDGILYVKHPKMIVLAEPRAAEEEEAKPKLTAENQKPSEPTAELQGPEKAEQKKETKESAKPLESKSKPELQQPEKIDQKKETREPPKPSERKPVQLQPQKVDDNKESDQIPRKTTAKKQPDEQMSTKADSAPKKLPEKGQKPGEMGEIALGSVTADGNDVSATALQRKEKAEQEKVMDSSEKHKRPSESVHGGDRKTRNGMTGYWSYHKDIGHFLLKLKKPGNLVNLVVVNVLVLVLALYIKNAIISRGKMPSGILEGQED